MFVIQLFFEACHALYAIGRNGYFILLSGHLLTVSEKFKVCHVAHNMIRIALLFSLLFGKITPSRF